MLALQSSVDYDKKDCPLSPCAFMDSVFLKDRDIALAAVTQTGASLQYLPDAFRRDQEIVMTALDNGNAADFVPPELFNAHDIAIAAESLFHIPEVFRDDEAIVMRAVDSDGLQLKYASERLRRNIEIVTAAVSSDGRALEFAGGELNNNREIVRLAINYDSTTLSFASTALQNDNALVLEAISHHYSSLRYAGKDLRFAPDFLLDAFKIANQCLRYVPWPILKDPSFIHAALDLDISAFSYLPFRERFDENLALKAVSHYPWLLMSSPTALRQKKHIVMAAVLHEGAALEYAAVELRNDPDVVRTAIHNRNNYGIPGVWMSLVLRSDQNFMNSLAIETWTEEFNHE